MKYAIITNAGDSLLNGYVHFQNNGTMYDEISIGICCNAIRHFLNPAKRFHDTSDFRSFCELLSPGHYISKRHLMHALLRLGFHIRLRFIPVTKRQSPEEIFAPYFDSNIRYPRNFAKLWFYAGTK